MRAGGEFSAIARYERRAIARRAFVRSLPVLMGYLTMGFAAGVLMAAKGPSSLAPLWAGVCAFAFVSGTLSFSVVPAFAGALTPGEVAVLALAINFRYSFYGFSMLARWRRIPLLQKWFLVHSLADEIYALDVACTLADPLKHRYYCLWNHALNTVYWVVGVTAGAIAGSELPIPSKGVEFAMAALFLVILTDQLRAALRRPARAGAKKEVSRVA